MKKFFLICSLVFVFSLKIFAQNNNQDDYMNNIQQAFGFEVDYTTYGHTYPYLIFKMWPTADLPVGVEIGGYYQNDGNDNNNFALKMSILYIFKTYNRTLINGFLGVTYLHEFGADNVFLGPGCEIEYFIDKNISIAAKAAFPLNLSNLPQMGLGYNTLGTSIFVYF